MLITGNEIIYFCFADEEGVEFLSGILQDQTTEHEEVINVDDSGFLDDPGMRIPKNFTRTQKTPKALKTSEDIRKDFASVVKWEDRDKILYTSLLNNLIGWYLWVFYDGSTTRVAVITVYKNQAKENETDPDYVEFLISIPTSVTAKEEGNHLIIFDEEGKHENHTEATLKQFLPYMCFPYNLKTDAELWKFSVHWLADKDRAANFINNLLFVDVKVVFPTAKTFKEDYMKTTEEWNEIFANRPAYGEEDLVTLKTMWDNGDLAWGPTPEKKYTHSRKGYDLNLVIMDQMKVGLCLLDIDV